MQVLKLEKLDFEILSKVCFFDEIIILKVLKITDESVVIIGIHNGSIISKEISFIEKKIEIKFPTMVPEITQIFNMLVFTYHEYNIRKDTLTEDDLAFLDVIKVRVAWYASQIKELEYLSK